MGITTLAHRKIGTLMKHYLTFLFFIALLATGCDKTKYVNIDPNLKKAFFYQKGSYWVYTDSLNSDIDSFFVANSSDSHDMTTDNQNEEHININISEYTKHATGLVDTSTWIFYIYRNLLEFGWRQSLSTVNRGVDIDYNFMTYPFEVGPLSQYSTIVGTIDSVGISCLINNNTFSSVAVINYYDSSLAFNDIFYLSETNGLIKIKLSHPKINTNRIWELVRWHIVK